MNCKKTTFFFLFILISLPTGIVGEQVKFTPAAKTPDEIFKYLGAAVELIREKGEKAYDEITDPGGPWVEGDWYIFVNNFAGYNLAHLNKKMEGQRFFAIRDVKGIAFFAALQKEAMSDKGRGWVEYWWPKPGTTKPARKFGFVIGIPEKRIWVGTGAYDMSEENIQRLKTTMPPH